MTKEFDWEAIEKCLRGLPEEISELALRQLVTHGDQGTYTWLLNLWMSDQKLHQQGLDYSDMTVRYHRLLFRMRIIAGYVPTDPNDKRDPKELAQEWLVEHNLVADQTVLPFINSKE